MISLFNTALLKEQLKRYWPIAAITFLAYFLGCILPIWNNTGSNFASPDNMLSVLEMRNPIVVISNILTPLAAVISIFSYMYRQSSTGALHSLPFTKKQLFASNALAGYLLSVLPLFLLYLLLMATPVAFKNDAYTYSSSALSYTRWIAINLFPNGLQYGEVINTLPIMFGFFTRALLSFTFYYAVFLLAATMVGNHVIYFLVSAILPFLAAGFYLLFVITANYYLYGFSFDASPIEKIMTFTNPVLMSYGFTYAQSNEPYTDAITGMAPYYTAYIAIIVLALAASAWMYHVRRLERAGDTVVFTPVKNFFIFMLSLSGMIMMGVFLMMIFNSIAFMYVGFVIGFVIAFIIAQMIAEKSFNVFYKYKAGVAFWQLKALMKHAGVALALLAAVVVTCKMDLTGYVRYVPEASEVMGVFFSWSSNLENYDTDSMAFEKLFVSDPQIISETLAAHGQVIDARDEQRKVFLSSKVSNHDSQEYIPWTYQPITYLLKNGKIVFREYRLTEVFHNECGFSDIINSEPVLLSDLFWLNYPEYLNRLSLNPHTYTSQDGEVYANYKHKDITIFKENEMRSLAEAVKKDYINYKLNNGRTEEGVAKVSDEYDTISFDVRAETNQGGGLSANYYVSMDYGENTLEWLNSHGYELEESN